MKKKLLIIVIASLFLMTSCQKQENDNERFAKEYTKVSEYNVFKYKDIEDIIKMLNHGTGIIYLGFPECPWCQAYVKFINEVADMEGLEKIYYYNIYEDRKNNTDNYKKIVDILSDYLQYDENGDKRIYVPVVISVLNGEVIGYDDESSKDTLGFDNPDEYWSEDRVKDLKKRLSEMIGKIVDNKCSECNE